MNYFKHLGVTLYKNGYWYRTQKVIAEHSRFALHNLFITFNQIELTAKDKCKLFDTLVGSILNSGAEIFGYHTCKSIEHIHCIFLRKLLCVQRSTNLECLYGEVGRYPMILHRKLVMIKFWIKNLKLNNDSLVKKTCNMLNADTYLGNSYNGLNWTSNIKHILDEIGMSNLWIQHNGLDIKFASIKQRIIDTYKQDWHSAINNSGRLMTYCKSKVY